MGDKGLMKNWESVTKDIVLNEKKSDFCCVSVIIYSLTKQGVLCSKGKYSGENKNPLKLYGNQTQ